MKISIILPILELNEQALRAICSINISRHNLNKGDLELIVICSDSIKSEIINKTYRVDKIYVDQKKGIYEAMNIGIKHAVGEYLYFIGIDDILLLDLKEVIELMVTKPKIILFNNYWGSKGLYKNLKNRYRLISKNWCHQGVIYRNDLFLKHGFYNLKYRVQADHYFNLKALSSLKKDEILKSQKIIAWYSANGFSTRSIDSNFHKDLPNILKDCYGLFFKYILILKRKIYGLV